MSEERTRSGDELPNWGGTGLARLRNALRCSLAGLASTYRHEEAFRQEVWLAAVLLPLGWWLGNDGVERALLCGSVVMVMVVELMNTAVESVVDRIGPELHTLSKRAKDIGSAAVLLALLLVALVWALLLLPRLL